MKFSFLFRVLLATLGVNLSLLFVSPTRAQTPFKNPLQVEQFDDPLLPNPPVNRPLSPLEKFRLEEALKALKNQAENVYQQGKTEQAFTIWYRELRLRQKLDLNGEVKALGRVGEMAWSENRSQDFRNIRERLRKIEAMAQEENNRKLLETLAESYEKMREIDGAIALYQQLLEESPNPSQRLETIARLQQAQFNYTEAANTYQNLLAKAEATKNRNAEIKYLETLKSLYQQTNNPQQGITIIQRLINTYQQENNQQPLPALLVSLGENYQKTQQLEQASKTYEKAFQLAWSQQKYAIASEALENLAQLYRNQGAIETTLDIYKQLLIVQEQSYNSYGLMVTYDKIGEIHQQRNQPQPARNAYENALKLAQSLSYRENYFQEKIQNLKS